MPTRASLKEMEEVNSAAARIVALTTAEPPKAKNAAAVALGLLGASKGGKARAASMSATKRKEIARKAALKRWGKKKTS
jgi:hypothetical protein